MPQRMLEVNTPLIWHWSHFLDIMALIKKHRFTGLIIHQQNILALLAKPSRYYQGADKTNLNHEREQALLYLQRVSRYCREQRLTFWLQGEAFPEDGTLEHKFPEFSFTQDAAAGENFLLYFYRDVVTESLSQLPLIDGIILSLQTPVFHQAQWTAPLKLFHRYLRDHQQKMVLRDYTDDSWPRRQLPTTLAELPPDVRASVKATATDYRPGFANNPVIGAFEQRKVWIDIDLWGIDYGWTLLPCLLIDEIQGRLSWVQSVIGDDLEAVTVRISWEWINNCPLSDSVNDINLFGLALMLSSERPVSAVSLLDDWLYAKDIRPSGSPQRQAIHQLYFSSHDWMCRTPYLLGRMMHQHSQLPSDINSAQRLLHADNRSANWTQSYQPLFPASSPSKGLEQRELISIEQQQSEFLARHLQKQARDLQQSGILPPELGATLVAAWERANWYTQVFSQVRQLISNHLYSGQYGDEAGRLLLLQAQQISSACRCAEKLDNWLIQAPDAHPDALRIMMDPQRLESLASDCRSTK
ncbi:hypothetical protein [Biostraticola tofi]|nr:hypothetical protein [Biostraticola tofi]